MAAKAGRLPVGLFAAIGATIATPFTVGVIGVIAFPVWAALTLFGWFTMVLPTLISSLVVLGACRVVSRSGRITAWWSYLLAGIAVGLAGAMAWCVILASQQNWQLSFGFGDPMPGSPEPDPLEEAWHAASFLGATGAVLGAWTTLFFWFIRRPDRDQPPASSSNETSA